MRKTRLCLVFFVALCILSILLGIITKDKHVSYSPLMVSNNEYPVNFSSFDAIDDYLSNQEEYKQFDLAAQDTIAVEVLRKRMIGDYVITSIRVTNPYNTNFREGQELSLFEGYALMNSGDKLEEFTQGLITPMRVAGNYLISIQSSSELNGIYVFVQDSFCCYSLDIPLELVTVPNGEPLSGEAKSKSSSFLLNEETDSRLLNDFFGITNIQDIIKEYNILAKDILNQAKSIVLYPEN